MKFNLEVKMNSDSFVTYGPTGPVNHGKELARILRVMADSVEFGPCLEAGDSNEVTDNKGRVVGEMKVSAS